MKLASLLWARNNADRVGRTNISTTIVDDYNASLYITSEEISAPPIRVISNVSDYSTPKGIARYESPNYVLGLAAATMNEVS